MVDGDLSSSRFCQAQYLSIGHSITWRLIVVISTKRYPGLPFVVFLTKAEITSFEPFSNTILHIRIFHKARQDPWHSGVVVHQFTRLVIVDVIPEWDPHILISSLGKSFVSNALEDRKNKKIHLNGNKIPHRLWLTKDHLKFERTSGPNFFV